MEKWLWAAIAVMALIIVGLLIKIYFLRKSAKEIETAFADRLITDTNTRIGISGSDRYMRSLADRINAELRVLRRQQNRFYQGDLELKNAITNISHDLRTPLTAICGYLDLLDQTETSETVERYLAVIRNRAEMLTELTEELFRYSVIISGGTGGTKEEVVVNHVLEESVAAFYTALMEKQITPVIQIPEQKVVRSLDRAELSRVFANLISNAIRYSDGDLEIVLRESGELTFTNHAPELNEVQVGRLFDRFYTVEAARKSTGLGLAISRTLIEKMGGTISAHYQNGKLSICIRLP